MLTGIAWNTHEQIKARCRAHAVRIPWPRAGGTTGSTTGSTVWYAAPTAVFGQIHWFLQ